MWAAHFIDYEQPATWLNSGGAGTMGYAVPAAMGAKAGAPERTVWAIDGDGCFQMTNQKMTTCALNNIPIRSPSSTTAPWGWSASRQTLFYNQRYWPAQVQRVQEGRQRPPAGDHGPRAAQAHELGERRRGVVLRGAGRVPVTGSAPLRSTARSRSVRGRRRGCSVRVYRTSTLVRVILPPGRSTERAA
ncbi:hypothetical protein SCALM49S_01970 [Streptomyces californicus]